MIAFRLNIAEGDVLDDKYTVVRHIGRGSYGDVFMVKDKNETNMALKVLRLWDVPGDMRENLVKRFQREYEAAKMPSDYLIHTLGKGSLQQNPYFVMEYCQNGDLSTLKGKEKKNLPQLIRDVLLGLHILHSEGKVHRDLKPENVLIRDNGKAALTDFGVVGDRKANVSDRTFFGRPKQVFGSPLYMSPEMADRKGGGITYLPTVDLWSLGVMIYELLTDGQFPFGDISDDSDMSVLPKYQECAKRGNWNVARLRSCMYGQQWEPIVRKCLTPDYQNRYQSATAVLRDLEPMIGHISGVIGDEHSSRTSSINRLVVTQGENIGAVYYLDLLLKGAARMVKIGRSKDNDVTLPDDDGTYLSRHHFTLERSATGRYWTLRDGQWNMELRQWQPSTNGTYLNATPVPSAGPGLHVFTGDIITVGEYKLKIE